MFRHVGIVVNNIDKQLDFYKNIIGLEVYYDKIESGNFLEHIIGIKNVVARIIKLGSNDKIIVELLCFKQTTSKIKKNITTNGITHFAITVDDVEKVCDNNIFIVNKPKINKEGTVKVAFCRDTENNFIELVEELNIIKYSKK